MSVFTHFILWNLGLAKPWTFYTQKECNVLEAYAKDMKRIVEIGCWQGVNTKRMRSVMDPNGTLFAVDPYAPGRLGFSASQIIAHREVAKEKKGQVVWLRMFDVQAAARFQSSHELPVDLIFSDAVNSYEGLRKTWEA